MTYSAHPDSLRHGGHEWHQTDGPAWVIVTDEGEDESLVGYYPTGVHDASFSDDAVYLYMPTSEVEDHLLDEYGIHHTPKRRLYT